MRSKEDSALLRRLRTLASLMAVASVVFEAIVVVGSWFADSLMEESPVQSLLTANGIRWYIGSYADVLATPFVVWVILCGCAYGILKESGIADAVVSLCHKKKTEYTERIALQASAVVAIIIIVSAMLLTFGPHSVLLSATGSLSHSSISAGVIPIAAFLFAAVGITYGYFSSRFHGVAVLFDASVKGVTTLVPVLVLYVFVVHLAYLIIHCMS